MQSIAAGTQKMIVVFCFCVMIYNLIL
jgi:hypothetical protein